MPDEIIHGVPPSQTVERPANGLYRPILKAHFPKEFITPSNSVFEQLARTRIKDENVLRNALRLYSRARRHNVVQCEMDLLSFFIGVTSVGGVGLGLAAQVETGIIAPEALGVPLSRGAIDSLKKERENKEELRMRRQTEQHAP